MYHVNAHVTRFFLLTTLRAPFLTGVNMQFRTTCEYSRGFIAWYRGDKSIRPLGSVG
jgi:hypothetical protein